MSEIIDDEKRAQRDRGVKCFAIMLVCLLLYGGASIADPVDAPLGFATRAQVFSPKGDPAWIGLEVHLDNVAIVGKAGRGLWIGARGHRVFVVPIDPSETEALAVGARIDLRGELRRAPAASQAKLLYSVGSRDARRIEASPHIIDAWSLSRPM